MRILIHGSSKFKDYTLLEKTCEDIVAPFQYEAITTSSELEIVSVYDGGHGVGVSVDKLCKKYKLVSKKFKVDWNNITSGRVVTRQGSYGLYNIMAGKNTDADMIRYVSEANGLAIVFDSKEPYLKEFYRTAKIAGLEVRKIKVEPRNQ